MLVNRLVDSARTSRSPTARHLYATGTRAPVSHWNVRQLGHISTTLSPQFGRVRGGVDHSQRRQAKVLGASMTAEAFGWGQNIDAEYESTISAASAATEYFDCFNKRDVEGMLSLLAEDCDYCNYGYNGNPRSRKELSHVLNRMMANLPEGYRIVIDSISGSESSSVGLVWHAELNRRKLLNGQGVSFLRINGRGQFDYIRDAPEHTVKANVEALPTLNMAASLLSDVATVWAPQFPETEQEAPPMLGGDKEVSAASGSFLQDEEPPLAAGLEGAGRSPQTPSQMNAREQQQRPGASTSSEAATESAQDLAGVWIKDTDASDLASYERALNMMGLNGLQKTTALKLIEGLEIREQGSTVTVQFLTVVPFFKVTEEFSTIKETTMSRRDLRSGQQTANAAFTSDGLKININWRAPYACTLDDLYQLQSPNTLHVTSRVTIGGRTETTLQVYHRREQWQPRFSFGSGLFGR
ncbi:hypothetical protein WJX75_004036 [Coccomyxa subellipsoidea]|uniref:SnoaL-like domain-containing protein n=1 Tax=Coccomyxa subellipsoidea TaxID=248742 RepID=A0ABR2Z2T9_9CHLO